MQHQMFLFCQCHYRNALFAGLIFSFKSPVYKIKQHLVVRLKIATNSSLHPPLQSLTVAETGLRCRHVFASLPNEITAQ